MSQKPCAPATLLRPQEPGPPVPLTARVTPGQSLRAPATSQEAELEGSTSKAGARVASLPGPSPAHVTKGALTRG